MASAGLKETWLSRGLGGGGGFLARLDLLRDLDLGRDFLLRFERWDFREADFLERDFREDLDPDFRPRDFLEPFLDRLEPDEERVGVYIVNWKSFE